MNDFSMIVFALGMLVRRLRDVVTALITIAMVKSTTALTLTATDIRTYIDTIDRDGRDHTVRTGL